MTPRSKTVLFILVLIFVAIFFDLYIISSAGNNASISQVVIDAAYETPMVSFLVGFLCGHFFWRMPEDKNKLDKLK